MSIIGTKKPGNHRAQALIARTNNAPFIIRSLKGEAIGFQQGMEAHIIRISEKRFDIPS